MWYLNKNFIMSCLFLSFFLFNRKFYNFELYLFIVMFNIMLMITYIVKPKIFWLE